jgi:hypothetical protein
MRACQAAPPDPVELAEYLADLLLTDGYGLAPDPGDYADLLGDTGTARIRQCIATAFSESPRDYRARNLMEAFAKAEGDVDAPIATYATELDDRRLSRGSATTPAPPRPGATPAGPRVARSWSTTVIWTTSPPSSRSGARPATRPATR